MTYVERADAYAKGVVAGDILACRYIRLACQRHLDDLKASKRRDYPYRFDEEKAARICAFVERKPHVKGKWARKKETIKLEPWQCFILSCAFGWLRKEDGLRRYREAYLEIPRKNAKSTTSAGVGLYMLAADDEVGAEVYSGATSKDQAHEVFRPAKQMAEKTPEFLEYYGVQVNASNIHIVDNGSRFEPLIGKPGDGASPSCAIIDEFHEHKTSEQKDAMKTGMGAREQPMLWIITTAGSDISGPCYSDRTEAVRVLEGSITNDELFVMIYTIDEGIDWTSEEALRMANPNYGISVSAEFLRSQQQEAVRNPRKAATFKTKHLNLWVTARDPYFNIETWNKLKRDLTPDDLAGEPVYAGLDLSSKVDITAVVFVFRKEEEGRPRYYVFGRYYIPEATADEPQNEHYRGWIEEGYLIATDGQRIDYDLVGRDILEFHEQCRIQELAYDPWGAEQLTQQLEAEGITRIETPQNVKYLSEPMKELEAHIRSGDVYHDGNPVLTWAMGNVTAKEDPNENVFPRKERPEYKIDPAVGLIMAFGRAFLGQESESSAYDERGVIVI